jgi:hypothetical protein
VLGPSDLATRYSVRNAIRADQCLRKQIDRTDGPVWLALVSGLNPILVAQRVGGSMLYDMVPYRVGFRLMSNSISRPADL